MSSSEIRLLFPEPILIVNDLLSSEDSQAVLGRCIELYKTLDMSSHDAGHPLNTHGIYDLNDDKVFDGLSLEVSNSVKRFVKAHGSEYKYTCQNSWLNVYERGQFHGSHNHPHCTFSAVYYAKVPDSSGSIFFNSPYSSMLPVPDIEDQTEISYDTYTLHPKENMLVMFRSYLLHKVSSNLSEDIRISLAYNF